MTQQFMRLQIHLIARWIIGSFIRLTGLAALLMLVAGLIVAPAPVVAQRSGDVQALTGTIDPGEVVLYWLPDLRQGQQLTVYAQPTSGNLDPLVGLLEASVDPNGFESAYEAALDEAMAEVSDPLEAVESVRDQFLLAWDDDSGGGLTAALAFTVPADGDYRLLIAGVLSKLVSQTFGDYRLLIGLDAPQVLEGDAEPTGATVALLDTKATPPGAGIQEVTGTLTPDKQETFVVLNRIKEDDVLYVYLEATSGDLRPVLILDSFARKPIRTANLRGEDTVARLEYTFPREVRNYQINVSSCCEGEQRTSGDFRLLVGVNTPEVLSGRAPVEGRAVIRDPMQVKVGTRIENIVDVDQQMEFFTAVVRQRFEWADPDLAFNPESCQCDFVTFTGGGIDRFLGERLWPASDLDNRQGNRYIHSRELVVHSDGRAVYSERSTTSFQVDLDFRKYPFDVQEFVIRTDLLYPQELYRYVPLEGFGDISGARGEDEFVLTDFYASVSDEKSPGGFIASRFTFGFEAPRHLNYYLWRIFLPMLLIILVSWVTFFLKDYSKRIDVATGNLLLFIAFSWSLAENYPRLGYLTFLDGIMIIMFIVNALVVIYNVWLKRMDLAGQGKRADQIDRYLDWAYPLIYVVSLAAATAWFL